MKSRILFAGSILLCLSVFVGSQAFARVHEPFKWGSQINQSECPNGTQVVNVVFKVLNDFDSGTSGNNWALDNYVKHIQIVQTSPTDPNTGTATYCANVSYQGDFTTYSGFSPQNLTTGGTVGEGVVGTLQGGYISLNFTATFSPSWKTKGSVGTFDFGCDKDSSCPGRFDWTSEFFSAPVDINLDWWGWTYHAGNNGAWVNASGGNSGDITGN